MVLEHAMNMSIVRRFYVMTVCLTHLKNTEDLESYNFVQSIKILLFSAPGVGEHARGRQEHACRNA